MLKNKTKRMDVWLSDTPSLKVLEVYVKKAKELKYDYVCFDVPVAIEYGLSRTFFHLKVV